MTAANDLVIETLALSECDVIDVLADLTIDRAATRAAAKHFCKEAVLTRARNRRLEIENRKLKSELERYTRSVVKGRDQ